MPRGWDWAVNTCSHSIMVSKDSRISGDRKTLMSTTVTITESTMIRIGAKGGGCAGFSYVLDFDEKGATEFDLSYEQHGVNLVIDKKSSFFMMGTELDFNDGLLDRGFVFKNPAATGSCGCGTSFSA